VFAFMHKQRSASSDRPALPIVRPCRRLPLVRSDAGFTLIEVLVSAMMVVLIGSATAGALIAGAHFSGDQRQRSQAAAIAAQDQERLKGLSDEQLSGLNQPRTVTLNGTNFSVKSVATFLDATGASSCTSTGAASYKVVSTVSWTENYTSRPAIVTEESILARPVSGDLLAQASDEAVQWLQGVTVTATGPSTQSGATDANGCVVFAGLTPGSYIVTLADQNYVDPNGNASPPNATATVTSTGTAQPNGLPFHLGLAGSVVGTFTTGMTGVAAEADTISWLGVGASFGMTAGYQKATAAGLASSITTRPLFPFDVSATLPASYTNNYTVWAGKCLQMEPPSGIDQFTVTRGSTNQPQNIQEAPLYVATVNYNNGSTTLPVAPAHLKLTFATTGGTSCTSYSWHPTVAAGTTVPTTGWLANPGQPFVTSATSGPTESAASLSGPAQTGTLQMCADYYDASTHLSYNASTATFTNTSFTTLNAVPALTITRASQGTC
jgi:type II secretory pathway pseudopilin PulG